MFLGQSISSMFTDIDVFAKEALLLNYNSWQLWLKQSNCVVVVVVVVVVVGVGGGGGGLLLKHHPFGN